MCCRRPFYPCGCNSFCSRLVVFHPRQMRRHVRHERYTPGSIGTSPALLSARTLLPSLALSQRLSIQIPIVTSTPISIFPSLPFHLLILFSQNVSRMPPVEATSSLLTTCASMSPLNTQVTCSLENQISFPCATSISQAPPR